MKAARRHEVEHLVVDASTAVIPGRKARLQRWASLLAADPERPIRSLDELEYEPATKRLGIRADGSAIALAYADPVFRAAGLAGDTLGDAISFFELSHGEAHRVLCSCMNGRYSSAARIADRISAVATHQLEKRIALWSGGAAALLLSLIMFAG